MTNSKYLDDRKYLVLAFVVGWALRMLTLARKSLWLDEVVTLQVATMNVKDIITRSATQWEPHPPFYYLLMHDWVQLGSSEFILRFPSAILGILAVPMVYGLFRQWSGRWSAMASAWLLAIAPLHIWYSQEARMYALVCTLGLASLLSYSLGIRLGNTPYWVAWLITTVLGLYTDYSMLLLLVVQFALFGPLWKIYGRSGVCIWAPLTAWGLIVVLFLPQLRPFLSQIEQISGGAGGYLVSLQRLLFGLGLEMTLTQVYRSVIVTVLSCLIILFVLPWFLIPHSDKVRRKVGLPLTLLAVGFYLMILAFSAILRGLAIKRQALILFPCVLGGISVALAVSQRRAHWLIGLTLLTLPLTGYTVYMQEQESWRDTARLLEQQAAPQDVILVNASYMRLPLDYYYHGATPRQGVGPESIPGQISILISGHSRVWLILSSEVYTDPQGLVQRWMDQNCVLLEERVLRRIKIRIYRVQD